MIEARRLVRPARRHQRASPRLGRAEDDMRNARVDHRPNTHQAWLDSDIEHTTREAVVIERARGAADRDDLSVRAWIDRTDRTVETRRHDAAVEDDDGADGNLAGGARALRLVKREAHVGLMP